MRFLQLKDDDEFSLVEREEEDVPRYAILSHSWEEDDNEYTFRDIIEGKGKDKSGYQKVRFCVEQAARDRLEFCWIHTCCIDGSNETELQHEMASILRRYQHAIRCYVYLSDVSRDPSDQDYQGLTRSNSDLRHSRWFNHALDHPELLASASTEFFSREGTYLGNRTSMAETLEEMRDILENTKSLDVMTSPQLKTYKQFEPHGPFTTAYENEPPQFSLIGTWTHSQQSQHGEMESYSSQYERENHAGRVSSMSKPGGHRDSYLSHQGPRLAPTMQRRVSLASSQTTETNWSSAVSNTTTEATSCSVISDDTPEVLICPIDSCGAAFSGKFRRGFQRRHMRTIHEKRASIECGICGKRFCRSDALRKHSRKQHLKSVADVSQASIESHGSTVQMLVGTRKLDTDVALLAKDENAPPEMGRSSHERQTNLPTFRGDDDGILTNVQTKQTSLTNETYFPFERIETKNSGNLDLDNIGTVYSDAFRLSDSERNVNIHHLANDVFDRLFLETPDDNDILLVQAMLPEFLRAFALEIGQMSETQMYCNAMMFIDKHQEIISQIFLHVSLKRLRLSRDAASTPISVHAKMSHWDRQRKRSKDEELEDKLTLGEPFPKIQANHARLQGTTSASTTQGSHKEPKCSEQDVETTTEPKYSTFAIRTPVYELLLERLRHGLLLVPSESNRMVAVRYDVLRLLWEHNTVSSKKTSAKAHTLLLVMDWDPLKFIKEQMYEEKPAEVVGKTITLTGSAQDAQAQTCSQYLSQIWPSAAKQVLLLLKDILSSEPGHRHECKLLSGAQLTAWMQESQFMVRIFGPAYSIAEVGEQFAWLSAALRTSPFESGVAYCTPIVRQNDNSYPESELTKHPVSSCTIQYVFEKGKEGSHTVNGQCWEHLFRNPVVVTGYPIPRRPQNNSGLEISISLMTALCQARTVTIFDGKPLIKGFCTMLVPTKHEEHVVIWHVLTNDDGSHISYTDPRAQNISRDSSDSIRMFDVERSRHIIGWCASARSYAGAAEASYDIGWSGLETPYEGDRLSEKTIRSKKLDSSGSFALGLKDIPNRHMGDQYVKRLMWVAGKFTVLFDVKDGRAWMFDGASSLLHLVRASLRFSQQDDFSDQFLFKPHNLEEAPPTKTGKAAAIWVLKNETNKRIKLYESTECFKERVEDILHVLEQIASYQDKAESSDIPAQQLEGFDFNAVAMVEGRIKPRITELPARGRGWIDFTRAIHAMNLFGCGFGELIRPTENQTGCSFWNKLPKGENHLAVSVSDITRIQQREGSIKGGLLRLVDNIYWHKPEHIFEACLCASGNAERHSDRIQILTPRGNLGVNDKALQNPGSLAPDGAVIFGHNSQDLESLSNIRRPRSTSTHQSASLSCYDSGIGSSLDSLSATPADSQFEAVSDTSAKSTRKRSSSTSMAGHPQGERSSPVGGMENKLGSEKIPTLPQTHSYKRSKIDLPTKHRNHAAKPMRNHRFTIGWISPLPLEKEAARLVMDEEYPQEEYDNVYYLGGRIGNHKVIIGMPTNMGLSNAAILAAKMSAGFPDIQYFLVVGIAGGVPNYGSAGGISEIVLGDVVVSYPRRKHGGVIQYDKGAWKDSGRLDFHGHTNGVHRNLMAAINNFRSRGCFQNVTQVLQQMRLKLDERRKNQYEDPGATCDSLFADTYEHQGTRSDDCKDCCDREQVISRAKRGKAAFRLPDSPFVHFGTIASSNQLQISVAERKRMQQQHEVLCFEMEAAGVMEEYPCMVIRGICDYADSHKNKGWQNYAAATAAAYAKGLLAEIPPMYCTNSS